MAVPFQIGGCFSCHQLGACWLKKLSNPTLRGSYRFSFGNALEIFWYSTSIIAPQDAHKRLVLQIVEWLTDLLSGLDRHELTLYITFSTGFKK